MLSKVWNAIKFIISLLISLFMIALILGGLVYYKFIYEKPVYVTPYGEKYHASNCFYLDDATYTTKYDSNEDAEDAGYEPCSRCDCQ